MGIPEKMKVIYTYTHDCEEIPMLLLKYRKKAHGVTIAYIHLSYFLFHFFYILNKMLALWEIMIHETKLIMYKMFHLHFPKKVDIYAKVCMDELTLAIDKILCLKNASTWISTFFTIHIVWVICTICLLLNTSYLIDSYIVFTLKMESVS